MKTESNRGESGVKGDKEDERHRVETREDSHLSLRSALYGKHINVYYLKDGSKQ